MVLDGTTLRTQTYLAILLLLLIPVLDLYPSVHFYFQPSTYPYMLELASNHSIHPCHLLVWCKHCVRFVSENIETPCCLGWHMRHVMMLLGQTQRFDTGTTPYQPSARPGPSTPSSLPYSALHSWPSHRLTSSRANCDYFASSNHTFQNNRRHVFDGLFIHAPGLVTLPQ
jgi:hypothetical protein